MTATSMRVSTARLSTHVLLTAGPRGGLPLVFVHGSLSSSAFWHAMLDAMPERCYAVAPDLRGFGQTDPEPIDATRGLRDFADDLHALIHALQLTSDGPIDLVGWSMGGGIAMQYAIDHAEEVRSLVLVAPISPYGFGGTRDIAGTPCWPDYAGSGGGTAAREYVQRLAVGDRSEESELSPRALLNTFYFRPPFRTPPAEEELLLDAVLSTRVGDAHFPGSMTPSTNWPGVAPGSTGVNNSMSPKYCDLSRLADIHPKPPVLWIRGADDQVVSDTSMFDFGHLGALGLVPGWPGPEVFPPQPMLAQLRAVLDLYERRDGRYHEEVVPRCGHSPQIEKPEEFRRVLLEFLDTVRP